MCRTMYAAAILLCAQTAHADLGDQLAKLLAKVGRKNTAIAASLAGMLGVGAMHGCGAMISASAPYQFSAADAAAAAALGDAVTAYEVANIHAQSRRDAARNAADRQNQTGTAEVIQPNVGGLVFAPYSYAFWKDFNGDGHLNPDELIGRGKETIRVGETLRFILWYEDIRVRGKNNLAVEAKIWNERGEMVDSFSRIYAMGNGGQLPSVIWLAEPGEEGAYTLAWYVDEKHVGVSHFRVISDN